MQKNLVIAVGTSVYVTGPRLSGLNVTKMSTQTFSEAAHSFS
jgi:hypothetical protein